MIFIPDNDKLRKTEIAYSNRINQLVEEYLHPRNSQTLSLQTHNNLTKTPPNEAAPQPQSLVKTKPALTPTPTYT